MEKGSKREYVRGKRNQDPDWLDAGQASAAWEDDVTGLRHVNTKQSWQGGSGEASVGEWSSKGPFRKKGGQSSP